MEKRFSFAILVLGIVLSMSFAAFAGGPVCRQPACAPMMCAPQPCMPQPCAPACMPQPCGPMACQPTCGPVCPPPACGPRPCGPQMCEENPLAKIVKGACQLVAGIVALPFKIVDGIFSGIDCPGQCGPRYPRMAMCCPPQQCMPAVCPPMVCAPPACGMGMARPAPVGFGFGGPRVKRFSPFSKKESAAASLFAAPTEGVFGSYW